MAINLWQIESREYQKRVGGKMRQKWSKKTKAVLLSGLLALMSFANAPAAYAQEALTAEDHAEFRAWLKDFRKQAKKSGYSRATLDAALNDLEPNPKVIHLNNFQPEFSKPIWEYLDGAVSDNRITKGKALLVEHDALLKEIYDIYSIPPRYLVAIWGMETSFGALTGGFNAFEALATLGYKGKRTKFARTQLMAALQIVESGNKSADAMTGSWAGAMGQTQFIPTIYLTFAVDHDGNGTKDIWADLGDVFASTSNYLASSGWQQDRSWGREVTLPQGFDYGLADRSKKLSLTEWSAHGVTFAKGSAIPQLDRMASIIAPAGHQGPAFMIFENFRAVLRYNNSTSYALAVCLLADQFIIGERLNASWPRHERALSRDERMEFQQRLTDLGFDTKGIDGILGANSRAALRDYQRVQAIVPDGFATATILETLRGN